MYTVIHVVGTPLRLKIRACNVTLSIMCKHVKGTLARGPSIKCASEREIHTNVYEVYDLCTKLHCKVAITQRSRSESLM